MLMNARQEHIRVALMLNASTQPEDTIASAILDILGMAPLVMVSKHIVLPICYKFCLKV